MSNAAAVRRSAVGGRHAVRAAAACVRRRRAADAERVMARGTGRRRGLCAGIGAALAAALLLAGCSEAGSGDAGHAEEVTPVFTEASVHDPSVVRAEDGAYYVFGSHLAAAKSADLMR